MFVEFESLCNILCESLFGWKFDVEYECVILGNGDFIGFINDGFWWIDRFLINIWYRGNVI